MKKKHVKYHPCITLFRVYTNVFDNLYRPKNYLHKKKTVILNLMIIHSLHFTRWDLN